MRDPFHAGERSIQELTGERSVALLNGQLISDAIPAAAGSFLTQQQYCAIGGVSRDGTPWASFLAGRQGFARTDESRKTLFFELDDSSVTLSRIPPLAGMRESDPLGLLFIELATRRRLRVSGRCIRRTHDELVVSVDQANPLCPKYIQRRRIEIQETGPPITETRQGEALDEELLAWVASADTFFVATARPDGSANVSHRGGRPGFVRHRDGVLRIPDYPGNSMFATLGNLAVDPRAGLTFVDFATNRQLQLTGDVRFDLGNDPSDTESGGTGRWWELSPRRWFVSALNRPFTWRLVDTSPFNP